MKIIRGKVKKKINCVITIGVFDGIHKGHQYLLNKVKKLAERLNLPSLVITFWPHPEKVIKKNFLGCITSLEQKLEILRSLGIDYVWVMNSSPSLFKLDGLTFFKFITKYLNVEKIVVGQDFRFGCGARYSVRELKDIGKKLGIDILIVKKKKIRGVIVSSSRIRREIVNARFDKVRTFLGREFVLEGKVVQGKGLGKKIGFPTLNISFSDFVLPKRGVYATKVLIDKKKAYLGACNIGFRPTVSRIKKLSVEVHVIDFFSSYKAKKIEMIFLRRIRNEKKFSSLEKLRRAITHDISYLTSHFSHLLKK